MYLGHFSGRPSGPGKPAATTGTWGLSPEQVMLVGSTAARVSRLVLAPVGGWGSSLAQTLLGEEAGISTGTVQLPSPCVCASPRNVRSTLNP